MNYIEFDNLTSEISTLENLLKEIPEDNIFDRISLQKRLKKAKKNVENINPYHLSKKAKLTFRGPHVVRSEAISAAFATQATMFFSDAIAAISAAMTGDLKYKGKIPKKSVNQLMITGMATGSFGFEFDLPKPDENDLCPNAPIVENALNEIQKLFKATSLGSDEELVDVVEEIHPRAVKKVYDFLSFLQDQHSLCGFEFNGDFFRFSNQEQLERAVSRLADSNIRESEQLFRGEFEGVLPNNRTFEFKTLDDKSVIKGKIGAEIDNPDLINREWLHKLVNVKIMVTQVGDSQPRYTLMSLDALKSTT